MNLYQLLEGLQCSQVPADRQIGSVVVDSRQVKPGDLFVCLVGERVDSHNFAAKAVEQGAAAVVCQRDLGLDCQVLVENTRVAYGIICCNLFDNPAKKIRMVGVTGTNGKTTITT
ncbi:MAG: UDP-N-acetylmuramoyl-L-alanyl-D-glutamate--2,6-diaminopimelate ligase, partial [Oscillospiraceae bacterium]|nr:UDP-N-acetylmuramoyl-L-alanyl-D-glutamate--2,6-diaminopimelate ligase [Oscillospiraceae bacterium]